jgi:ribonuclease R
MKQFIGQTMAGKVSSVTNFGAFVTLDDVYVDGLIHISELGKDYFEFDEASHSLRGRASGKIYRLQDPVNVLIAAVDSDTRRVDFKLEVDGAEKSKGTKVDSAAPASKRSRPAKPAAPEVEVKGRSSRQRSRRKS